MSKRVIGFLMFTGAGLFCGFTLLYSSGIVGVTKKPNHIFINPGCFCHGDSASASTRVWIQGPDSVPAGRVALFKICVARDSSVAAGFNVATFFGSLGLHDTLDTQLIEPLPGDSLELTHTHPKLAAGVDTISWFFYYRAPSTVGRIDTIYANGNSVNLNGDPDGDHWNFAPSVQVRVTSTADVQEPPIARSFNLAQNYPNPFNPTTTIRFELPVAGKTTLIVYDLVGRMIKELVNGYLGAGVHRRSFAADDIRALSSGVYVYQLVVQAVAGAQQSFVATEKMVLLK